MKEIYASLDVFDYSGNKLCGLYDSQNDIVGQAYDVQYSFNMTDGISELTFNIPYMIDGENNFRWDYLKSEYMIRLFYNNKEYWFIAKKPTKRKEGKAIIGSVTCKGIESSLKTKNIYMEFDDTNGIGTANELLDKILAGTDWRRGETDTLYEKDGVTEKVRSITSGDKQGALGLIVKLCNLFKCYPVFRNDVKLVDLHAYNNRTQLFEGEVGKNLDSLTVGYDSDDIITRLYVEGEYGENGYVGIDSANPTGLNYIMNFDYYREIGVMTQAQEDALEQYTTDISEIKAEISDNTQRSTALDDDLNLLIGQCQIAVYYKASGFTTPVYLYGDPLETRIPLVPGDNVVVLQNDGTFRYETIETTPEAIVTANDYGIAKFIRKAAGKVGTKEVSIEAKQKTINDLQRKIDATIKQDVIDKYTAEIAELNDQIEHIYVGADVDPSIKDQLVTKYIPVGYDGNTDITDRIIVPASTMRVAYDDFEGTYATLYPMSCSAGTGSDYDYQYGTNVVITYTPIKANGTVMTPAQVNNYMRNVVTNATSHSTGIMEEDSQNLILRVYEIPNNKTLAEGLSDANRWSAALHDLQTAWDRVRASYNWFGDPTRDPAKIFGNTEDTSVGLYPMMHNIMKTDGMLHDRKALSDEYDALSVEQDEIEADFIVAMGDLLRDGYWQSNNYIPGQEQALYDDAFERLELLSRPSVSYQFGYLRVMEEFGIPMEDIKLNAVIMIHDDDLSVHDEVFITKITIGISDQRLGTITVSNQEITFSANDLSSLISRMSQLSDLLDQRNTLYERAKAISKDGSIFIDRLNGQIDVMKNQILSSVSNWYTDEQGNIMFESADGTSAMMLSGAGWMIASSKDDNGDWVWRTAATGAGLSADVITAGFISTERLEANSISANHLQPNVGSSLVISGNPTITNINNQIAPAFSPEQDYSEGDIVMHNGILFVFTQDHPAGPWNSNHVMSTSMTTQIELLPDRIISYVGEQGYSRTFTQSYEPTDPNKGDRWVVPGMKWSDVFSNGSNTWRNIRDRFIWQELLTGKSLYYNGSEWTESPEAAAITTMYTRIEQSENEIRQEAARTYLAKADDYQNVNDIINKAESLAEDSAEAAKNASIAKTERYQSAAAIVESAIAVVDGDANSLPVFSTSTQYYKGDSVQYNSKAYMFTQSHKGAWNASHVKEIVPYIAQTTTYQTADAIVSSAVSVVDGDISSLPAFSTTTQYYKGDMVKYDNKGYQFTASHKGAWNASHVQEIAPYLLRTADYNTVNSIIEEAQRLADDAAGSAKEASIAKTDRYQSASAIVESAVAVVGGDTSSLEAFATTKQYYKGDAVKYSDKGYVFTTSHKGAWNASHVKEITPYIAQTTTYQTADAIVSSAVSVVDGDISGLPAFNTTTQYYKGDMVKYNNKGYQFTASHKGTWNTSHVQEIAPYMLRTDDYATVADIIEEAQNLAEGAAGSAKEASIAKTDRYQSASAIVESAVAVVGGDTSSLEVFSTTKQYYKGDAVKYNNVGYVFTTDHKGAWNASHVKKITPYIAQTTTYQTADAIVSSAVAVVDGEISDLPVFSTSTQYYKGDMVQYDSKGYRFNTAHKGAWSASDVTAITPSYKLVSGITIQAAGIKISGARYLKLESGAYIDIAASNIRIGNNRTVADMEADIADKSNISGLTAQYYKSTSPSTPTGGSWSTNVPTHQDNWYIWTRTKVDYNDGTNTKYIPSANGVCTEGVPGSSGSPGKGISSVVEHYLKSSKKSGVKTTDSGWSTDMQTPTKEERYLWNYETINYTNPTGFSDTTPVIIGMYSEDGVSITNVTEMYLASNKDSGVTRATSGWTDGMQEISSSKPYLWNYEIISYSNGSTQPTDPVIIGMRGTNGGKGDPGTGISSIVVKYRAHSSYTVDPENGRTAAQIESDWANANLWSTTAPSFDEDKRYLWTWTRTTLSDGTKNDFRVSEYGVNAAYDLAKDAADAADDIIAGRQNAFYAKNIENTGVTVDNTTLHVTSEGNMYIDTGGSLYIRSASSTSSSPKNAVVINKTGIAIESTGKITIKSNGDFTVNTGGKFLVNASNFTINAQTKLMNIGSFVFDEKGFTFKDTDLTSMRFGSNVYMDETSAVGIGMSTHSETSGGGTSRIKDIVFKTGYQNINKITERYLFTYQSSGVTRNTSGWTTNKADVIGDSAAGGTGYLWNYKTISFNGGANIYTTPEIVATIPDGESIENVWTYYLASSQSTGVTRSTSGWSTSTPEPSESAPYLWCYVRTKIALNVNYQYSTPFMAAKWTQPSEVVLYYDRMLFGYMAYLGSFSLYPDITHEYNLSLGLPITGCHWDNAYINNIYYDELESFSSRYIKHDIQPMGDFGEAIDHLEPVSFVYNSDKTNKKRYGLIYEDTIEYMPEICHNDGENKSLVYSELIPILLNEIKSLRSRVKALEQ